MVPLLSESKQTESGLALHVMIYKTINSVEVSSFFPVKSEVSTNEVIIIYSSLGILII